MSLRVPNIQVRYMNEKCPCFDLIPARRQKQIGSCSAALINEILDSLAIHLLLSIFFLSCTCIVREQVPCGEI